MTRTKPPITVTILTRNSVEHLGAVLDAVAGFDEILILDTGSDDGTLALANEYPAVVVHHSQFTGFGPLHNEMVTLATNDWILSLDSDEVLDPLLATEILEKPLDLGTVYSISRHNLYNGRFIKGCGWYPDLQHRLFNRTRTRFSADLVHEKVITAGMDTEALVNPLVHYSYRDTADFLNKMQSYSSLFAKQYAGRRKGSLTKALLHGGYAFVKSYLVQRGVLDGKEGLIISVHNANTTFYKYVMLAETDLAWRKRDRKAPQAQQ